MTALVFLALFSTVWAQSKEASEDSQLWEALDREVTAAIAEGQTTGASLLVGRADQVLYYKTYGSVEADGQEPVSKDHLFDAASLTKPLATATSVLLLAQDGRIDLQAPLTDYLPLPWTESPTVAEVLSHCGGLPPVMSEEGLPDSLLSVELAGAPGEKFVYSDVGYMLLALLVERDSGLTLDRFYEERIAGPLELSGATFRPEPSDCVPTYGVPAGTVHDPRARAMNGVSGHAGLFLRALDVHQQLARTSRLLKPEWRELLFQPFRKGRTLGLDQDTQFSSARGLRFSPLTSAGHTGFTGTSFWWDEPSALHVVLLTSRLHPDNKGSVIGLRRRVATLVADHFLGTQVRTGLDELALSNFERLDGKKVGFVVNQTSRDRFGRHLTELISSENNFEVVRLFTPEHGLLGIKDEKIEHGFHQGLGVPIMSLYGETRAPKEEWFRDLDVVVFDLQDVGVRYYTYISTLKACLEVAKKTSTEILVLDRPNPLGGTLVDGHRAEVLSFIACDTLPLVHGMTMGEVGQFLNREIGAKLGVETMVGWDRSMGWRDTGLALLSPSPNLAELEAIQLYPVLGQVEWCQMSVGRGTSAPFRLIGAPYIKDPSALAHYLQSEMDPVFDFQPRYFVPASSKFEGELCGGVEVSLKGSLDRPAQDGLRLARLLERRYPGLFQLQSMAQHLGRDRVDEELWTPPNNALWRNLRKPYLLYR